MYRTGFDIQQIPELIEKLKQYKDHIRFKGLCMHFAGAEHISNYLRLKNQKTLAAKNEEIKASHFRRQLSELEMKALRAQMNPHFIFNCMNSINRMILSGEGDSASRYLTKFAKVMRMILENS